MKAQLILYNQLRSDYLVSGAEMYIYIHHTWRIIFQWRQLRLNTSSKIIDYVGWKQIVENLKEKWKKAEFILAKSFFLGLKKYTKLHNIKKIILVKPVENYVYENFLKIWNKLEKIWIELEIIPDEHSFFLSHEDFQEQYSKPPIMEYFYRFMRKRENILVDEQGNAEWGQWNYDKENRKFERNHKKSWNFSLWENKFLQEAQEFYGENISLRQPVNREEALKLLDYFIQNHLDSFGKLEDAMYEDDSFVHHSLLSTAINFGFLSPRELVQKVAESTSAMNNKEGFIRQILGWREYMYHFFEYYKDSIYKQNYFSHEGKLPDYFWENAEKCEMNCLSQSLQNVQENNYSHHIQRLMIIGNFSLLSERNPHELNRWFFEYYTDAFEWVVSPNVLAMSQFADGGRLATKPYISSANYIDKMSDYCQNCKYDKKEKYTENACPYNYLYWAFVDENKKDFEGRQPFVLKNLEKIDIQKVRELKEKFLEE